MGVIDMSKIVVIAISLIIAIIIIKRKEKVKTYLFILILLDLIVLFELCFGTLYTKPQIIINGDNSVTIEVGTEYVDKGAISKHHNRDISNKLQVQNNVDINKLGSYEVKYTVKVFFTEISAVRTVNVIDTTPPNIELKGGRDIKIIEGTDFQEDGYIATDNYDGDITSKVIVEKEQISDNQFKMNYKVMDSSNNEISIFRVIDIIPKVKPDDVNKNGVIYLTFDDGPSLDITPHILDILKEEDVKATFFIINFEGAEKEELIKRIVAEGHGIGIHGYSHDYKKIYSSDDAFMTNVTSLKEKILNLTGVDTKIIRFPGGSSNTVSKKYSEKIMTRLSQRVLSEGYMYYDWNVTSGDSGDVKTAKAVYRNVTNRISKNKANIVLMHDFSGNNKTLDCLRDIIHYAKENGYSFEAINEQTPLVMHSINN